MSDRFLHQFCLDEDGPVTEVWTLILICPSRVGEAANFVNGTNVAAAEQSALRTDECAIPIFQKCRLSVTEIVVSIS